jgi:hypothetical protein
VNIKNYFFAGLLLLLAVPVGAEEMLIDSVYLEDVRCAVSKATVNGNTNAYCSPEAIKKKEPWYAISINTHPDPCLAKMEQAMRAMEAWHAIEGDMLQRLQAGKLLKDLDEKWGQAKRDCWKERGKQ